MVDDFDVTHVPQSRVEEQLENMNGGTNPRRIPQSRVEYLLDEILDGGLLPEGSAGQYVGYNSSGEGIAISPDTEPVGLSNKLITSGAVYAALAAFPKGLVYRGAVNYYSQLPTLTAQEGDAYTVRYTGSSGTEPDGTEYAYGRLNNTLQWIAIGPDLSRILSSIQDLEENKADKIAFVTVEGSGDVLVKADPDTVYYITDDGQGITSIIFQMAEPSRAPVGGIQYHFAFESGRTGLDLILPNGVKIDLEGTVGAETTSYPMEADTRYEIDILDNYGVVSEWATS